jgi:hypothetical protein
MAKKQPFIEYLNMGPVPIYVGFTTSPEAYRKEMARLQVPSPPPFVGYNSDATTHTLVSPQKKWASTTCIVCLEVGKRKSRAERDAVAMLLAHEATHVLQAAREAMGETNPGHEFEAYLVQYVAEWMLSQVK